MKPILPLIALAALPFAAFAGTLDSPKRPSKESGAEVEKRNAEIQAGEKAAREFAEKLTKSNPDAKPPVPENGKLRRATACGVKVDEVVSDTEVTGWRREAGRIGDRGFFKFESAHNMASGETVSASDWTDGGTIKRDGKILRVWVQNPGTAGKYKKYGF